MNKSIYYISLDLHNMVSSHRIFLKRGDTARELNITLFEGGKPYEITSDVTAYLNGVLPTGTTKESQMAIDGNTLRLGLASAWTTTAGEIVCEVRLYKGASMLLISPTFTICVGAEYSATVTIDQTLPLITSADNGKVLYGNDGVWDKGYDIKYLDDIADATAPVVKQVPGVNMFDEDHNSEAQSDPEFYVGTVYLDGYVGDIVVSCNYPRASSVKYLHVYDANGDDMDVDFAEGYVYDSNSPSRMGCTATIPEGAVYLTFQYRKYYNGDPYVKEVMVSKGNTIDIGAYVAYEPHYKFVDTVLDSIIKAVYVSPDGDDGNDGLTHDTAFATFERALGVADVIYADRAVYYQSIEISGRHGVRIYPYDNDEEYTGEPRAKIVLSGGDDYPKTDLSIDDGLYYTDCNGGLQFSAIFDPDYPSPLDPLAPNGAYRANVFVHLTPHGRKKLKPVLSKELCAAEDDTFWWDSGNKVLWMNISTADFDSVTVHARLTRIHIEDCSDVRIQDLAAHYNYSSAFVADNSMDVVLTNCEACFSGTSMGFEVNNSNVVLDHCYATNNWYDGFNFHGFGYTEMIDCTSVYNWDDGCSHHNGCIGVVTGGEFSHNGKGGVTPAYGANVNIYNILAVDNDGYGVGFLSQGGDPAMRGLVSGCAFVNNPIGLKVSANWTVNAIGCKYSGNTSDKLVNGTLNEY